jgi:hypothetical protein
MEKKYWFTYLSQPVSMLNLQHEQQRGDVGRTSKYAATKWSPNSATRMWLNVLQISITNLLAIEGSIPLKSVSKYIA